jgi:hypothetical protein
LIIGVDRSAIGTLVERTTRFTMLLHLPRMDGYGVEPRVKNGPALAGRGAEAMKDAIAARITTLPDQLRQSLATRHEREHQRATAAVLPQRNRPRPMERRGDRCRGRDPE